MQNQTRDQPQTRTLKYHLICLDCNVKSGSMEFVVTTDEFPWLPMKCTDYGAPELPNLLDFLCEHSGHRIEFRDETGRITKPHKLSTA